QLHARRVVFVAAGGRQQRRGAGFRPGPGAPLEQEAGEAPVAGRAGHAQRGEAVVVPGVERGRGIEQQRGHAGGGAARGVVQRGVAVAIGGARVGAVGEQGHHRLGAAVPAVAGGRQQRREPAVGGVDVHSGGDERAQQAQVGQGRGGGGGRALVALALQRQPVGIGTPFEQGRRVVDAAGARGRVQRAVAVAFGEHGREAGRLALHVD